MHNYYEILNIKPNSSKNEIKKAFRIEALKWHPDRNKSSDATERMQLINEAYLILHDDEARLRYDKEYKSFSNFEEKTHMYKKENYSFNDDILNDWIKRARYQAKDMLKLSIEDLVGMSKVAFTSAWDETKNLIFIFLAITLVILIIGII